MSKKRLVLALGVLLVGIGGALVANIGPRNLIGMLRYDTRHEGRLKVGDPAPEVLLLALDGSTRALLGTQLHGRPLVVVFGSFT